LHDWFFIDLKLRSQLAGEWGGLRQYGGVGAAGGLCFVKSQQARLDLFARWSWRIPRLDYFMIQILSRGAYPNTPASFVGLGLFICPQMKDCRGISSLNISDLERWIIT